MKEKFLSALSTLKVTSKEERERLFARRQSLNSAFKSGFLAYNLGRSIDDNDYADGTDECLQFVEGWLEAERFDVAMRSD